MNWINAKDPKNLPKGDPDRTIPVVMIDRDAAIGCFLGWYDPSDKGGGFYFRDGMRAVRVICSHFIELPKMPQ